MFGKSWEGRVSALTATSPRSAAAMLGLQRIAAAITPAGSVKAKVRAAHEQSGLSYSRVREMWYGRARRIADAELARIEAAARQAAANDAVVPFDSPELSLAYLRSVEIRVASALDDLRALLSHMEAASGHARGAGGGGDAPDAP